MNEKLEAVRGWIARDDERREREKALPKALCRTCGGWARAGEGTRAGEQDLAPRQHPLNPERAIIPRRVVGPRGADDWRRECGDCSSATAAQTVSAVLGAPVQESVARSVLGRMIDFDQRDYAAIVLFPTAQASGSATGRRWGHVSIEDRERVRLVVAEVIRERVAGPCQDGACGVCGLREHLRWFEGPSFLVWPDGSRAPVCGACQDVLDRRPEPVNIERLRTMAVEAATGFSSMGYTAPPEFRIYAESADCDGNGHALPWDYSDGIRAFRDDLWSRDPRLAPEGRVAEFEARFAAMVEASRADHQTEQKELVAW